MYQKQPKKKTHKNTKSKRKYETNEIKPNQNVKNNGTKNKTKINPETYTQI